MNMVLMQEGARELERTMQSVPAGGSEPGREEGLEAINQQLEKANEQMRLANQALRAVQQELHSLTGLLDSMHQQVELLNHEVVQLRDGYVHALDHVPYPVLLADRAGKVGLWNSMARRTFDLSEAAHAGIDLSEIPVQPSLRLVLSRKHRTVVESGSTLVLRNQVVQVKAALYRMDVHFASLRAGILVIFRERSAGMQERKKMNLIGFFAS